MASGLRKELEPGQKLAGYEIVARLKSGGMAALYLGRRAGAGGFAKHVAIKVIHSHLGDDRRFVDMFLDEARLAARIEHPNVVHTHELGEEDGRYFLVMEYVNGCALADVMTELGKRGRRLSIPLAVWIATRVASGLHAAHTLEDRQDQNLEVVHRDVSPQNVLLAYKGYIKLIDFGVAKFRGRIHQTNVGAVKGKLGYMAPEQAGAKPLDRRTDVYALGIVLWEMLANRRLFMGRDDMELFEQVRNPSIVAPSTHNRAVTPALDAAVMAALAPDRRKRPRSANDFRRSLGKAVPEALALDEHQLSEVLLALMTESLKQAKDTLPPSVSGILFPESLSPGRPEDISGELVPPADPGPDFSLPSQIVGPDTDRHSAPPYDAGAVKTMELGPEYGEPVRVAPTVPMPPVEMPARKTRWWPYMLLLFAICLGVAAYAVIDTGGMPAWLMAAEEPVEVLADEPEALAVEEPEPVGVDIVDAAASVVRQDDAEADGSTPTTMEQRPPRRLRTEEPSTREVHGVPIVDGLMF